MPCVISPSAISQTGGLAPSLPKEPDSGSATCRTPRSRPGKGSAYPGAGAQLPAPCAVQRRRIHCEAAPCWKAVPRASLQVLFARPPWAWPHPRPAPPGVVMLSSGQAGPVSAGLASQQPASGLPSLCSFEATGRSELHSGWGLLPEFSKYSKMVFTESSNAIKPSHRARVDLNPGSSLGPCPGRLSPAWTTVSRGPRVGWLTPHPPSSPVTRCGDSALHLSADAPDAEPLCRGASYPNSQGRGQGLLTTFQTCGEA